MCGFAGFCDPENIVADRQAVIEAMCGRIAHRGPDSRGNVITGTACLGFCRMGKYDAERGNEPIKSEDGRFMIVMDGTIQNSRELQERLAREDGCLFHTRSDAEVVLQTYLHYGEKTASMLQGMFAFVILDTMDGSLYGARDPFGIKPLYYTRQQQTFLFASEQKAFLEFPSFQKKINPEALKMFLVFQYVPLSETILSGVYRLEPGRFFTLRGSSLRIVRYFDPLFRPQKMKLREAVEKIDRAMQSAVFRNRTADADTSIDSSLSADAEVGAFLSGGVDSGYVLSLAESKKVYSIGFEQAGFDETARAEELCSALGLHTQTEKLTAADFFAALPEIQYYMDEPDANLSAVPLYFLAKTASKDLNTVFSGEGADELFGGYLWYIQSNASLLWRKLPKGFRKRMAEVTAKLPEQAKLTGRGRRFFAENAKDVEESYIGQAFIMDDAAADGLLVEKYRSGITFCDVTKPYYDKVRGCDDLTKKQYLDMNLWMPNDILLKADRMTMAHSLKLRVPYMDPELWEVACTLPSRLKMRGRNTKIALRKAAARHIPKETAEREKAGFPVPFRYWLREDPWYGIVKEALTGPAAAEFFDTGKLLAMLEAHRAGTQNNGRALYTVYSFLLWYRAYFSVGGRAVGDRNES